MIRFLSVVGVVGLLSLAPAHRATAQAATQDSAAKAKAAEKAAIKKEVKAEQKADAKEAHPHIAAAIRELTATRGELNSAAHDFGGHRVAALKAVDEAIAQLRLAQKFDKK
jgi:predicted solute-binding protein